MKPLTIATVAGVGITGVGLLMAAKPKITEWLWWREFHATLDAARARGGLTIVTEPLLQERMIAPGIEPFGTRRTATTRRSAERGDQPPW